MIVSETDYLDVLDLIHEAALEPAAWGALLRSLAELTNCIAGGVTVEDVATRTGTPLVYFGFDENHVAKTFDHYLPMNPLFEITPKMQPGFIVTNGDVVPIDTFRRTEFYDGWARPQGLCCPVTLVLHRQGETYCPLTLVRPDGTGDIGEAERALLARFSPHLQRAMRVSMQLDLAHQHRSAMEVVLDQMSLAIFLLDGNRRIASTNAAAETLLTANSALTTVKGKLACRDPFANRNLQNVISDAMTRNPNSAFEVKIERSRGRPLLVTVLPLAVENRFAATLTTVACCAVFVSDPDSGQVSRSKTIARSYGLTPAESRLLDSILCGAGVSQAAEQIGISTTTAKTHLQRIFSKTGTNRQAELINLVMSSVPPLRPTE